MCFLFTFGSELNTFLYCSFVSCIILKGDWSLRPIDYPFRLRRALTCGSCSQIPRNSLRAICGLLSCFSFRLSLKCSQISLPKFDSSFISLKTCCQLGRGLLKLLNLDSGTPNIGNCSGSQPMLKLGGLYRPGCFCRFQVSS